MDESFEADATPIRARDAPGISSERDMERRGSAFDGFIISDYIIMTRLVKK
jgi:hypothetical protein